MPESIAIARPGYTIEAHLADCIAALNDGLLVPPGSIDAVVTSPPYNLGIRYSRYDDTISREDYLAWTDRWAAAVARALADSGSLFLNIGSKPRDPAVPFEVLRVMREHFELQNVIHWVKSLSIEKADVGDYPGIARDVTIGHYKPINSDRFVNDCHEYVFHLTKTGDVPLDRLAVGVPYQDKTNTRRWKSAAADVHCRGNVWFIPYRTISDREKHRPHPATFPPKLPELCLRLHGARRIRRVMDPFLGIGNTAIACCRLGVSFVGFEIDPGYFAEAARAIEAECGSSAT